MKMRRALVPLVIVLSALVACGGPSEEERINAEKAAVKSTVRQYYAALLASNGKRACDLMTPAEAKAAGEWTTELGQTIASAFGVESDAPLDCVGAIKSTGKSLKESDDAKYIRDPKFQQVTIKGSSASVVCCGGKIKPRLAKTGDGWLISGGLWGDQLARLRENRGG